ncbi:MAG: hypothetical protein K9W44_00490 [Candidatus Lokiarchaeota archaeon]|nr:hypothetical protein [Candidatus Harpocratesius repetitus]
MKKQNIIALDSNVFRNRQFIDYLIFHKDRLNIGLPIIVQVEVAYFYKIKGFSWEIFKKEMKKFDAVFMDWKIANVDEIITRIFNNKQNLSFKHHFRDYLIGLQSEKANRNLITYNTSHFNWLNKVEVKTPEDFVKDLEKIIKNAKTN